MATSKQAKKRIRTSNERRMRNRAKKSAIKTFTKHVLDAIDAKDAPKAETELRILQQRVDKAAKRSTMHKNTASRKKSRLQRRINKLKAAGAAG